MLKIRKGAERKPMTNKIDIQNNQKEATIYLYGDIGGWFGVDHLEWVKEFNAIDAKTIHLRIDSDGGDIFAARTMKTAIMQHKAKVIAHIDGLAASAASFLIMGADEIEIVDGGFLMIHNGLSLLDILGFFNIDDLDSLISDLTKERNLHEKINESIANDYAKKTGKSKDVFLEWMANTKWFTAKEALDEGLVDRIYDGEPIAGNYDLSLYDNVPEELKLRSKRDDIATEEDNHSNKRKAEKALRDAGFSRNDAVKIVAKGFQDEGDPQNEQVDQDVGEPQSDADKPQSDSGKATEQTEEKADKRDKVTDLIIRATLVTLGKAATNN
jgi:ATP-dependent Clp protease, protease subunit